MIKTYKDTEGIVIDQQFTSKLMDYEIEFLNPITKEVEMIESHFQSSDVILEYFLKANETFDFMLNYYKKLYQELILTKQSQILNFKKYESRVYTNGILSIQENELRNTKNKTVCLQLLDIVTQQPIYVKTLKSLSVNDEDILLADYGDYDQSGNLLRILYMPTGNEQDWVTYNQSNLSSLGTELGLDLSYYLTATLEPI